MQIVQTQVLITLFPCVYVAICLAKESRAVRHEREEACFIPWSWIDTWSRDWKLNKGCFSVVRSKGPRRINPQIRRLIFKDEWAFAFRWKKKKEKEQWWWSNGKRSVPGDVLSRARVSVKPALFAFHLCKHNAPQRKKKSVRRVGRTNWCVCVCVH